MMGPTHLATGILASAALSADPAGLAVGMAASLLPDIDEPNSIISRKLPFISFFVSLFGHRKLTHSLLGLFLFSAPLFIFARQYFLIGGVAYLTHLVLDSLTPMGVPWLFPFGRNYSFSLGGTGGIAEGVYIVLLFVVGTVWGQQIFKPYIVSLTAEVAKLKSMLMFW